MRHFHFYALNRFLKYLTPYDEYVEIDGKSDEWNEAKEFCPNDEIIGFSVVDEVGVVVGGK